ncbi:hypothetical protein FDP41_003627 [Naegleria fowleri]|uniref:Uncharacterized protein n=1 Tax=Naegleria fowleri TaxID=5763 RepID=A0A6A5BWF1_NAEFO|nr:uncharacterized protein FDP41_003627 [Naegleria fowleri]KAF0977635.1 hypothetical protein FDP41_003627 [Naegleria fowleri]
MSSASARIPAMNEHSIHREYDQKRRRGHLSPHHHSHSITYSGETCSSHRPFSTPISNTCKSLSTSPHELGEKCSNTKSPFTSSSSSPTAIVLHNIPTKTKRRRSLHPRAIHSLPKFEDKLLFHQNPQPPPRKHHSLPYPTTTTTTKTKHKDPLSLSRGFGHASRSGEEDLTLVRPMSMKNHPLKSLKGTPLARAKQSHHSTITSKSQSKSSLSISATTSSSSSSSLFTTESITSSSSSSLFSYLKLKDNDDDLSSSDDDDSITSDDEKSTNFNVSFSSLKKMLSNDLRRAASSLRSKSSSPLKGLDALFPHHLPPPLDATSPNSSHSRRRSASSSTSWLPPFVGLGNSECKIIVTPPPSNDSPIPFHTTATATIMETGKIKTIEEERQARKKLLLAKRRTLYYIQCLHKTKEGFW